MNFLNRTIAYLGRLWIWSQEASDVDTGMFKVARLLDSSQAEFQYTMIPWKRYLIFPNLFNEIYKLLKHKISGWKIFLKIYSYILRNKNHKTTKKYFKGTVL